MDPLGDQPIWARVTTVCAKHKPLYIAAVIATQQGWFAELFYDAGFIRDGDGIYHTRQDALQQYGGYNDFYDFVFDLATSMASAKFPFTYNGKGYILWAWKGDYLNLGAGAELGIYYGSEPHWLVDTSLAMEMHLMLHYRGQLIADYAPNEKQWWITSFNPFVLDVRAGDLLATYFVYFSDMGMFNAFKSEWGNGRSSWKFFDGWAMLVF